MKPGNLLASPAGRDSETGAITIVETLIVISIGLIALTVLAQAKLSEFRNENAANAGRAIAAYSRAASVWLAENPPAADGTFTISDLQDCADPAGARYLSCTFGTQTPIVYARNDAGDPVNYGNLDIDVVITPAGATGVIDFGVFRSGDDENEDGLPDSRPDLASIAFQTAAEETGAGVLEFFEMRFARESPVGVQFDPNEADFDPAAIDDLSRLQARVGALAGDAPFLRLDGANQMTAGINFDNGMQVNMDGGGLAFQGPGDVGVSTDTGTLVVAQNIQTAALQSDSAVFDALTVDPAAGVQGAGFERFNQAPDVVRIDGDVIRLTARVQVNETGIESNRQNTVRNAAEITRLTGEVQVNETDIAANRQNTARNAAGITRLTGEVNVNETAINTNRGRIRGNRNSITAIINRPPPPPPTPPPPPPICSPLFSAVQNTQSGKGNPYSTSCGRDCITGGYPASCGPDGHYTCTVPSGDNPVRFKTRNVNTLNCITHTANFYSSQRCRSDPFIGNPCGGI